MSELPKLISHCALAGDLGRWCRVHEGHWPSGAASCTNYADTDDLAERLILAWEERKNRDA